jgi:hypothetical protein
MLLLKTTVRNNVFVFLHKGKCHGQVSLNKCMIKWVCQILKTRHKI